MWHLRLTLHVEHKDDDEPGADFEHVKTVIEDYKHGDDEVTKLPYALNKMLLRLAAQIAEVDGPAIKTATPKPATPKAQKNRVSGLILPGD